MLKKFSKILYGGKSCLLGFFSLLTFNFLKFFSLFCLASSEVVLFMPASGKIVGGGRFQNQKFICAILELLQYILKKLNFKMNFLKLKYVVLFCDFDHCIKWTIQNQKSISGILLRCVHCINYKILLNIDVM